MKEFESIAIRYSRSHGLEILDQTLLPKEEKWYLVSSPQEMIEHIQRLAVRGAPLIGVAASLALADFAEKNSIKSSLKEEIFEWKKKLQNSRPTAVNLANNLNQVLEAYKKSNFSLEALIGEVEKILVEDIELCEKMAEHGEKLIEDGDSILTHCNSGALATAGRGTALGVIHKAWEMGKKIHVYVDETRPLYQGARLTAWELSKTGIPHTLICDSMAAVLMAKQKIQRIFVGADRIAKNGDAANKIGTYSIAVNAKFHGIPFYIVAPSTTFDFACESGIQIPVEERSASEIIPANYSEERGREKTRVWNPAFDVTPRALITQIISENGFFEKG